MIGRRLTIAAVLALAFAASAGAETIDIAIGHQSMCADTYTGGVIVKELHLIEKRLPHDGKYANADYRIRWSDYASGGPITNEMLAGKLNFGVMGDFPLIVNGSKFQATRSLRTLYVSGTGYNLRGSGNAIVVPAKSDIYRIQDLKGKSVSTPVGSAAWGMLIKALNDNGMSLDSIQLKNQAPAVGAANIAAQKIDAHADFCPWPEIMEYRGTGRKIFDGSENGVPYLHGLVVRKDFAEKYPEVVVAFIEALYDAGEWVRKDPVAASELLEKWTGIEKEVQYLYFSKGGHLTLDPTIKTDWVKALTADHAVLEHADLAPPLDLRQWVTEDYIRKAYADLHLDYDTEKAKVVDPAQANAGLPNEIWHARDGVLAYANLRDFLHAVASFRSSGAKLNATYVYDRETGLKLFGKTAFYVRAKDGQYAAFLRRDEARAYAAKVGGQVETFDQAVAGVAA